MGLASASLGLAGPGQPSTAGAHDAPMPRSARHGLLVSEPWAMQHWAPFDEELLARELRLAPGQLEAFLYNDHHTIAQLARRRGVGFETLIRRLTAWAADGPRGRHVELARRTRLMLVSGHLAQHVLFHVFHGAGVESIVVRTTGVRRARYEALRGRRWTARRIVVRAGGDPASVLGAVGDQIEANRLRGVETSSTPETQAARLAARQSRLLPCWFTRPRQVLDDAAPYGRMYLRHRPGHTSADVPVTRARQAAEDRRIARGLAGRPPSCWRRPARFAGDPGTPLTRGTLRRLGGVPSGFHGRTNDGSEHDHHDM